MLFRSGWSLNETARRLAEKKGRAHETLRQLLRRMDERAEEPAFDEGEALDERSRRMIARADAAGMPAARIAERYGRSAASVRRIVN